MNREPGTASVQTVLGLALLLTPVALAPSCGGTRVVRGSDDASVDERAISRRLDLKDVDLALQELMTHFEGSPFVEDMRGAEERPGLAVMEILNETDQYGIDTTNLRETFEELVLETGCFALVSATEVDRLKRYMSDQASDWYAGGTVPDAGNLFGFRYVIGGTLKGETERGGGAARTQYRLHLKAVDVESGRLLWKKSADITKYQS